MMLSNSPISNCAVRAWRSFGVVRCAAIASIVVGGVTVSTGAEKPDAYRISLRDVECLSPDGTKSTIPFGTILFVGEAVEDRLPLQVDRSGTIARAGVAAPYDAILETSRELDADDKNDRAFFVRGVAWTLFRKPEVALVDFSRAIELRPKEPRYVRAAGSALYDLERTEEAVGRFTEAIKLEPANSEPFFWRAKAFRKLKKFELALADANESLRIQPNSTAMLEERAEIHVQLGHEREALEDFATAIQLDPNDAGLYFRRGHLLRFAYKRTDEAARDFGKACELAPDSVRAHSQWLSSLMQINDYEQAVKACERLTGLEPEVADHRRNYGLSLLALKRYDGAMAEFQASLRLDPKEYRASLGLGEAHRQRGEYAAAKAEFERVLAAHPEDGEMKWRYSILLATANDPKYRDGKLALKFATEICEPMEYKFPPFLDSLAAALAETGDFDGAVRRQEEALALTKWAPMKVERRRRAELFRQQKPLREPTLVAGAK